jgi:hypothetical protein
MAADQPSALPILLLARVPCSSAPWMQPLLTMDALPSSSDGARVPDTQDSPRPSASAFPSAPFTIGHGPLCTLRAWHFSDPSSRSRGASPCHLLPQPSFCHGRPAPHHGVLNFFPHTVLLSVSFTCAGAEAPWPASSPAAELLSSMGAGTPFPPGRTRPAGIGREPLCSSQGRAFLSLQRLPFAPKLGAPS